jgi:cytochrome c-type biogenesis protein CcmH/NrfG
VRLLEQALKRDPRLYPARLALGMQAVDRGALDEGIAQLEMARDLRPWDPEVRSAIERARELQRRESSP